MIIPPTQLHRTTQNYTPNYERYLLNFYTQDHSSFASSIGQENFDQLLAGGCISFPPAIARNIRQVLEQLDREQKAPSDYAQPVIANLLYNIFLQILRHGKKKEPFHGECADKVQLVAHHITYHYDQELTLTGAAAMAALEPTYFSKQFKALTGFGFHNYLTYTRLQAAKQLLQKTELSMGEIAEQCGFSEANHFSNVFRRWNGISPSAYRKLFEQHSE